MKTITISLTALGILLAASLLWRWASRRRQLPCPAWLAWILENPLTEAVSGAEVTLNRIGLKPGERGLDVGCGPGRLSLPASQRVGPLGEIIALDIQPAMLERLRQRVIVGEITNLTPYLADISSPDVLHGQQFDRAWLVTVLGEIPNQAAALQTLLRLLKPGGVLSITEIFPDPHYQSHSKVKCMCQQAGFIPAKKWETALTFTQNFTKPS